MDRSYEYISAIAQHGGLAKAAEKLFITPSALSKYLLRMEEEYGVPLFDRVGKRMALTYAGERFLAWREQIDLLEKDMRAEFDDLSHANAGVVRVGIQLSDSNILATRVLPSFLKRFPQIHVEIFEESTRKLISLLEDCQLDFAILPEVKCSDNLEKEVLAFNYPALIVRRDSALISKAIPLHDFPHPWIDYDNLQEEVFVLPHEDAPIYHVFESFCLECGFEPNVVLRSKNMRTQVNCVRQGIGVLCSLDHAIASNFDMGELAMLSFGSPAKPDELILAHNRYHYLSEPAKYMMDQFRQVNRDLEKQFRQWGRESAAR